MVDIYAGRIPDRPAMTFQQRTTNWSQLRDWVRSAEAQISAVAKPGQRIGFLGKNSDWNVVVAIAAHRARVVLLGLNWRLSDIELDQILEDAAPAAVIVDPEYEATGDRLMPSHRAVHWILLDGASTGYSTLVRETDLEPSTLDGLRGDDLVWQFYTSGTTGTPKGALLSREAADAAFRIWRQADWPWTRYAGTPCLVWLPMFHLGGTLMATNVLRQGGHIIITQAYDIDELIALTNAYGLETLNGVPTMIHDLITAVEKRGASLPTLRYIVYGAAPVTPELLRRASGTLNCQLTQSYGSTETGGMISWLQPEDHRSDKAWFKSAGRAMPDVELAIVDEDWTKLPCGDIGEIAVRSAAIMSGYWNRPEATEAALKDGWVRTGDLGQLDADGFLYIVDRVADMIVSGAENIYPKEIEDAVAEYPGVSEVAVFGIPHDRFGQSVAAAVVLREGSGSLTALRTFLDQRLAGYKIPTRILEVDAIPRNPAGKIQRSKVREALAGREELAQ